MAYIVKHTDYANKGAITVNDSTLNTDTSVSLPGRNYRGYSVAIAEDLLHLLENFSSSTAPTNPIEGQLWYDTTTGIQDLKVYDGTVWKLAGSVRKSTTTPDVAILGDLWVDTDNQQLYLFNGASWTLVGPTFSAGLRSGVVAETLLDSNDVERIVLKTYINDQIVSIYSIQTFVPKVAIQGFSSINSGINISTKDFNNDGINDTKYWGIAEKAENLIIGTSVVSASNVLRKDTANITNYNLTVKNDNGIFTGAEGQLRLTVDAGQIGSIYHATPSSAFDIRVNNNGTTTLIRADSSGKVGIGINNLAPAETLDVKGTSLFSDVVKISSTENAINDVTGALRVAGGVNIKQDIIINGLSTLKGDVTLGTTTGSNVLPAVNASPTASVNLGSSTLQFGSVYSNKFYGSVVGNVTGTVTGSVNGSAAYLVAPTTFSMDGDVASEGFTFNGSAGGTNKVFTTSISGNFIDNKDEFTDVSGSDELLIYRPGTGLGKMYRHTFFTQVATVPIGCVFPFAGNSVPIGYLLCDGSEKSRSDYPSLFSVIGYTYGDPQHLTGVATFRLPDLRGRFALGRNNMDNADSVPTAGLVTYSGTITTTGTTTTITGLSNTSTLSQGSSISKVSGTGILGTASLIISIDSPTQITISSTTSNTAGTIVFSSGSGGVIDSNTVSASGTTQATAGILGNLSGSESVSLSVTNLPTHKHDLIGDAGGQYYSTNNTPGSPDDVNGFVGNGPSAAGQGQYYPNTGNMIGASRDGFGNYVPTPFDVMNPYLTLNYIIFTGKFS